MFSELLDNIRCLEILFANNPDFLYVGISDDIFSVFNIG